MVTLIDVPCAEHAVIAQAEGMEALWMGGTTISKMYFAQLDWGLLLPTDMIEIAGRVAQAVSIPLIVDGDQGGETSLNTYKTVQMAQRAGIAGITIEDSGSPKHAGLVNGESRFNFGFGPIRSLGVFSARLEAAVAARTDPDFLIAARTDLMFNYTFAGRVDDQHEVLGEVIKRGIAAAQMGVDVFTPLGASEAMLEKIAQEVPLPIWGNYPLEVCEKYHVKFRTTGGTSDAFAALYLSMVQQYKETGTWPSSPTGEHTKTPIGFHPENSRAYAELARKWEQATRTKYLGAPPDFN